MCNIFIITFFCVLIIFKKPFFLFISYLLFERDEILRPIYNYTAFYPL